MKALRQVASQPASTPVLADEILEFHAARILLLLRICGISNRIDGLTKMAKLDFFVRYPQFFYRLPESGDAGVESAPCHVEAPMVRHHYGPWDRRYYHVLAYLEGCGLMTVTKEGTQYKLRLTEEGVGAAQTLEQAAAFGGLCQHMRNVKRVLGARAGSSLKDLIYRTFQTEVAKRPIGETIRSCREHG